MKERIFIAGFLLGAVLSLIPKLQTYSQLILFSIYPYALPKPVLTLVWGVLFGAILLASQAILIKEGRMGLLRVAILIGVLVMVFWLMAATSL